MHQHSKTPAFNGQMPIWSKRIGIPTSGNEGRTVIPLSVAPQNYRIQNNLKTLKFPRTKKGLPRYIGFVHYHRSYIPRLSETIASFNELSKSDKSTKIDQELITNFEAMKNPRRMLATFGSNSHCQTGSTY